MGEIPEDLEASVEDQAQSRVEMSVQGYAKYLTPEATDSLRASAKGMPPRVNRFEVEPVEGGGSDHTIDVRYFQRDESFVVRSRWQRRDDAWMVVHAERLWGEGVSAARPRLASDGVSSALAATALIQEPSGATLARFPSLARRFPFVVVAVALELAHQRPGERQRYRREPELHQVAHDKRIETAP